MTQVGTIKEISGLVKAINTDGSVRVLVLGDPIYESDTIIAEGKDSSVKLSLNNGNELALSSGEKTLLDESVVSSESFDNTDVTAAQQAILDGGALPEEAPAAGPDGADGVGGFTPAFVADRYDGRGDVNSYNLGTDSDTGAIPQVEEFGTQDNQSPIANDDSAQTNEGTVISGNVLSNDTDDGLPNPVGALTIVSVNGNSTVNSDGNIVITTEFGTLIVNTVTGAYEYLDFHDGLAEGESLVENFSYTISDGFLTDTGTLEITLNGTNDRPIVTAVNDTQSEALDGTNTFAGALSASDVDASDTSFTYAQSGDLQVDSPVSIDIQNFLLNSDGTYSLKGDFNALAAGESATISFQYTANDGHGFDGTDGLNENSISAPQTVTLNITGTNDQPVISDINANVTSTTSDILSEEHTITASGEGTIGYSYFTVTETTTVTITTDGPTIDPELFLLRNDGVLTTDDFITSDDDSGSSAGSFSNSVITWTLEPGEYVAAVSDYNLSLNEVIAGINDTSSIGIHTGIVSLNFTANHPITIHSSNVEYELNSGLNTFTGDLATAIDDDVSDTHTYSLLDGSTPSVTTSSAAVITGLGVTVTNAGEYTVVGDFNALATGETAIVTFQYIADDQKGFDGTDGINEGSVSESKTVTLTITGTNDAPTISMTSTDSLVLESSLLDGTDPDVDKTAAGTFTIADSDGLDDISSITVAGTTFPAVESDGFVGVVGQTVSTSYGEITIDSYLNGAFNYTYVLTNPVANDVDPSTDTNGQDIFDIIVSDGTESAKTTVTIDITDDVPEMIYTDSQMTNNMRIISADDSAGGADGDDRQYNMSGKSLSMAVSLGADGGTYEWDATSSSFDANTVSGITFSVDSDGSLLIFQDQDGVAVQVAEVTMDNLATGAYTYTQNANLLHSDGNEANSSAFTLAFKAIDGDGDTLENDIALLIKDDVPTIQDDTASLNEDGTVYIDVFDNDSIGADGYAQNPITITSDATNGTTEIVTYEGKLQIKYTPDADYNGSDSISYTITDADGDVSNEATVSVTVTPVNDAPILDLNGMTTAYTESFENLINSGWTVVHNPIGDGGMIWDTGTNGLEVQFGNVGGSRASDGDVHAELDAHNLVTMSTTVVIPDGEDNARLTFDYKPRPGSQSDSDMKVTLGGQEFTIRHDGTVEGIDANVVLNNTGWMSITINISGLDDGVNTLTFEGLGLSNSFGAYLDNISLAIDDGNNFETTFTENGSDVSIADTDVTISDVDDSNIESAIVTLINAHEGDYLIYDGTTYDLIVGDEITVTITQTATIAEYQEFIKAIKYGSTSENPNPTDRVIEVQVNDGEANSNLATTVVHVNPINDAPVSTDISADFEIGSNTLDVMSHVSDIEDDMSASKETTIEVTDGPDYGSLSGTDYTPETTTILLGQKDSSATLSDWGFGSGKEVVRTEGEFTVTTTSNQGDLKVYSNEANHIGYGIGDSDGSGVNDNGETITVKFEGGIVAFAEVGFDGLGGHFHEDATQDGKGIWVAFRDHEEVGRGEMQSPGENPGNDYLFDSVTILVSGGFDTLVFSAESTNSGSSYEVRYVEATLVQEDSFTYRPIDSEGLVGNESAVDLSYFDKTLVGTDGKDVLVVEHDVIDLSSLGYDSWGSGQDRGGDSFNITDNVLSLDGNNWKAVALSDLGVDDNFDWSTGTLTFDMKATAGGEIQGVLFENDDLTQQNTDSSNTVKVFGSQENWGSYDDFSTQDIGDGWTRVEVDLSNMQNVNEYFTKLVFVNDDDNNDPVDNQLGTTSFKNVSFVDASFSVDGGEGQDTLIIENGTLDLSSVASIEVIQLGGNASLGELSVEEVFKMTDDSHDLMIEGTGSLTLDNSQWTQDATDTSLFKAAYNSSEITLHIDDTVHLDF